MRKVDRQTVISPDADVLEVFERQLNQAQALFDIEQQILHRAIVHANDDFVEDGGRAFGNIDVAEMDRIKRGRIDRFGQRAFLRAGFFAVADLFDLAGFAFAFVGVR